MSTIDVTITDEMLRGMLCNAFEGGSNYWYFVEAEILPRGFTRADFAEGGKCQDPDNYWHPLELIPTFPGGALIITAAPDGAAAIDDEEPRDVREDDMLPAILDKAALLRGCEVMAAKYPRHFADMTGENDDAITGLFGDQK
jgi:hypothetical protein